MGLFMSFTELRSWAHGCRTGAISTIGATRPADYDRDASAYAPASESFDGEFDAQTGRATAGRGVTQSPCQIAVSVVGGAFLRS
jgi:hypothetical protein